MLEICSITKQYDLKDQKVEALKGVTMRFRRSEFVAILGPSGCGKTTLLNVIGGLDRYTDGDLIIDGVSTKNFKDKDWDNYRNHRVGFVFQSYNLIPHQSILENVELALTLSGVKRKERRARAIEVLNKVGLGDKLKSKPNQLSGGQMQRVAIARALVNDPEIILADEPTGALDSKTSVQIMDLLKEVSKDRLVVMVTHNPDLATTYSTRVIRLLDGELIEDSKPYSESACKNEIARHKAKIEKQQAKETELLLKQKQAQKDNKQGKKGEKLNNAAEKTTQTKSTFKKTQKKKGMSFFTALFLSFKNLLTKKGRTIMVAFAGSIGIIGIALILAVCAGMTGYINRTQSESLSSYPIAVSSFSANLNSVMERMTTDESTEKEQNSQESNSNEVTIYDSTQALMQLGGYNYISQEFVDYLNAHVDKSKLNAYNVSYASNLHLLTKQKVTKLNATDLDDLSNPQTYLPAGMENKQIFIDDKINFSVLSGTTSTLFFEELNRNFIESIYDVYGAYPTEANQVALVLSSKTLEIGTAQKLGLDLTEIYPINETLGKENKFYAPLNFDNIIGKEYELLYNDNYYETDISSDNFGKPRAEDDVTNPYDIFATDEQNSKTLQITAILTVKEDAKGKVYANDGIMYTSKMLQEYRENCKNSLVVENFKTKYMENGAFITGSDVRFPINFEVNISEIEQFLKPEQISKFNELFSYYNAERIRGGLATQGITNIDDAHILDLYLQVYGASNVPSGIYFYASSFDAKENVLDAIDNWNDYVKTQKENPNFYGYAVNITDSSQFVTSILSTLVNIVSYVLVAFAAISLVVSSIMIGIITYTSVIERTKEIGVLRSVGASKLDVFRVFTAETVIIGLCAGLIGVGVASILSIFVEILLKHLTGVAGLAVVQPIPCIALVLISVFLTFIAGLIPSRIATKKDPVKALRTE